MFSQYVVTLRFLIKWRLVLGNGGVGKGPIMNPLLTSFLSSEVTESGSEVADWRLWQWWELLGRVTRPGEKP